MRARTSVVDWSGNYEENCIRLSKHLGRNKIRRKLFDTIYGRGSRPRSKKQMMDAAGFNVSHSQQAQNQLDNLASCGLIVRDDNDGSVGDGSRYVYSKDPNVRAHRKDIVKYADKPALAKSVPTKRNPVGKMTHTITISTKGAKVKRITIDEVASFKKAWKVRPDGHLPSTVSEKAFKKGVEKIVSETGGKNDWGGEKNDLYTTRLKLKSKRVGAAFAFKGPGKKAATLMPGMMGKNGDQIQRLFQTDAEVFFVQYWRDIGEAVLEQMRMCAVYKSLADGNQVYYCAIDGTDSYRLYRAYASKFSSR